MAYATPHCTREIFLAQATNSMDDEDADTDSSFACDNLGMHLYNGEHGEEFVGVNGTVVGSWDELLHKYVIRDCRIGDGFGPRSELVVQTAIFEYQWGGHHVYLSVPSLWDELHLDMCCNHNPFCRFARLRSSDRSSIERASGRLIAKS